MHCLIIIIITIVVRDDKSHDRAALQITELTSEWLKKISSKVW